MNSLKGSWEKTTSDDSAAKYPGFLEFRESGLYSARAYENGVFPIWDSGTWEVVAPSKVKISTNNDAEIEYKFSLKGNKLTFTDPKKVRIIYLRKET